MITLKKILILLLIFGGVLLVWMFIKEKESKENKDINKNIQTRYLPKWHGNDCSFQSTILQIYCMLDNSKELHDYCEKSNNVVLKNMFDYYKMNYLNNNITQNYNEFYQPFYDVVLNKISTLDLNNFQSVTLEELEDLNIMISGFSKLSAILAMPCFNLTDLKRGYGSVASIQQFAAARGNINKKVDSTIDSGMTLKVLFTILKYCGDVNLKVSNFTLSLFNKNVFFVSDDFDNRKGLLLSYQMYLKIGNVGHASCVYKNVFDGKFYYLCGNTNVNITDNQFFNHDYLAIIDRYKQANNAINYKFESKGDILYKL